jgi:hypothetical protein
MTSPFDLRLNQGGRATDLIASREVQRANSEKAARINQWSWRQSRASGTMN